jgi:hypothetical protein
MRTEARRSSAFAPRHQMAVPIALLKGQGLQLRTAHQAERVQQVPVAIADDIGQASPRHAHTFQTIGLLNTAR